MSKMIKAPWSQAKVDALNAYQRSGMFHEFTCPGDDGGPDDAPRECIDRVLVATRDGWVCACGEYKQDWAHEFMTRIVPPHGS